MYQFAKLFKKDVTPQIIDCQVFIKVGLIVKFANLHRLIETYVRIANLAIE
jgi:hypothetical protein